MNWKTLSLLLALAGPLGVAQAQALRGDPVAGARKSAQCVSCHATPGYKTASPQVYRVPMLAGQTETYLALALSAYQLGDRKNPTMRTAAAPLSDQDILDLSAYYARQKPAGKPATPGRPAVVPPAMADLAGKLAVCASCHGADFVHNPDPANPVLAGQYPDYLLVALKGYRYDKRPLLGRKHAVMSAMVYSLSEDELKRMADFLGSLPGPLLTVPQAAPR